MYYCDEIREFNLEELSGKACGFLVIDNWKRDGSAGGVIIKGSIYLYVASL